MCGHAGTVGALRPVRRLPAPAGRPRAGRRPGQAARAARHRGAGGAHRGVPDGAAGLAAPAPLAAGPGYLLTPKAARRLDEAAARIYRTGADQLGRPLRPDRARAAASPARPAAARRQPGLPRLRHAGRARPGSRPAPADDVDALLDRGRRRATSGSPPRHAAGTAGRGGPGPPRLGPRRDRPGVRAVRRRASARSSRRSTPRSTDEEAYAARFRLVHAWRTFLFRDPQLPPALLPERWPGTGAADFFDRHAARLRPAADRYVDRCLDARWHRPADRDPMQTGVADRPHDGLT